MAFTSLDTASYCSCKPLRLFRKRNSDTAAVLCIVLAFHEPKRFHTVKHGSQRIFREACFPGNFHDRDTILLPEDVKNASLCAVKRLDPGL